MRFVKLLRLLCLRADVLNFAWILLLNVLLQAMPTASMDGCALYFGALDVLLPP